MNLSELDLDIFGVQRRNCELFNLVKGLSHQDVAQLTRYQWENFRNSCGLPSKYFSGLSICGDFG